MVVLARREDRKREEGGQSRDPGGDGDHRGRGWGGVRESRGKSERVGRGVGERG